MLYLLPLDAAGKPGLLLLILPVLAFFGILVTVYVLRTRANKRRTGKGV